MSDQELSIRFTGDLQRIRPEPGDVFFLSVQQPITLDMADHIRAMWKKMMGDVPLMVLSDGIEVGCMKPKGQP